MLAAALTLVGGLLAMSATRSLLAAGVVWLVGVLSTTALASSASGAGAGAGKVAAGIHGPAFVGALLGVLLQTRQTAGRHWVERVVIHAAQLVASYFVAVLAAELWPDLGIGMAGIAGFLAAGLVLPTYDALPRLLAALRDTLLVLLGDVPFLRRLISHKLGAAEAAQSTESVDKPVVPQQESS